MKDQIHFIKKIVVPTLKKRLQGTDQQHDLEIKLNEIFNPVREERKMSAHILLKELSELASKFGLTMSIDYIKQTASFDTTQLTREL